MIYCSSIFGLFIFNIPIHRISKMNTQIHTHTQLSDKKTSFFPTF